ncbi:MAG TPA: host attachment family protein [Steroidobacteraceae bacterium]|nr:host attachment family protein [Steroidobacteraceae bacterium]
MESVQVPANALVLVSDGRRARLLRNQGTPVHPKLVVEQAFDHVNPPTREQGTDKPGRRFGATVQGGGVSRGAIEQTDYHQLEEERFASEIAELLYKLGHAGNFEELVVVAPPKMLGDLRAKFHPRVAGAVVAELPRDLTQYSVPELGRMLS